MSATLGNIKDLQTFLRAENYTSDFRPVRDSNHISIHDTETLKPPGWIVVQ